MSVTLHIVNLWHYYVCCTRSGVTRCTIFMVLFLCRMCQYGFKGYIHYASQQAATRLTTHVAAPASHFVNAPATLGDVHVEDFFSALRGAQPRWLTTPQLSVLQVFVVVGASQQWLSSRNGQISLCLFPCIENMQFAFFDSTHYVRFCSKINYLICRYCSFIICKGDFMP